MKKSLLLLILTLISISSFAQGVTRSAVSGKITDDKDTPVLGAQVVVVDVNSGTLYGALTDEDGYYRISNVKPGGPYKFSAIYVGYTDYVIENIFIQLGETKNIDGKLSEDVSQLDEVIITASKNGVFSSKRTGASTAITQSDINKIPQASRSVADFVRLTPQAQISEGNDGFSISIGGQNNRFNSIYIDGAVSNDVFGLAGSGTNGGQTGVNPFSVDAIESYSVQVAPFDVRVSGFAGGAISAITRSGSNNWEGSAYSFLRNQDLVGKTPPELASSGERTKVAKFSSLTSGFRLGGPIIKDKLFFFVNYERGETETPQPFDIERYEGSLNSVSSVDAFRQRVLNRYGYNIGTFDESLTLLSNNITLKFDANLNKDHNLSLKYNLITADNLEARNSDDDNLGFSSGSELFENRTHTLSTELNSTFGNKFANSFVASFTAVRDDRDPDGNPFPSVEIREGRNSINIGAEPFSTANKLDQNVFTLTDNFEIFLGKHSLLVGTHHEFFSVKNVFFPRNFGFYRFNSIEDFINGDNIQEFRRGYSLIGGVGDDSQGSADFKVSQHGVYIQDEFRVLDNLRLTAGFRIDVPVFEDGRSNADFNTFADIDEAKPATDDTKVITNLRGARVGQPIKSQVHYSPRLGLNWDIFDDKTSQLRGGVGIFTSRIPLVWPGGAYNNNGVSQGETRFRSNNDAESARLSELRFNPDINSQLAEPEPGSGVVGGNIDLVDPNIKLPQLAKFNLGFDQKINALTGFVISGDFIYSKTISDVFYENINIIGQESENSVINNGGPDNRPFFNSRRLPELSRYNGITLLRNTSQGNAWNASVTLRKSPVAGFSGSVSYSYGDSEKVFDGSSSILFSNWRSNVTVNGKNNSELGRSSFAQGHRITSNVSYEFEWLKNFKTTIALFYDANQGRPSSYIYGGEALLGDSFDERFDNALLFVPASRDQINLVDLTNSDGEVIRTADEQYADLEAFINGNDYLRSRKGKYAERNGDYPDWNHILDLRLLQDFKINTGGKDHIFQASLDIFNFTNLLNKDWGQIHRFQNAPRANGVSIIDVVENGENPQFNFDRTKVNQESIQRLDDSGINSSRWQMQVGLRYIFK